MFRFICGPCLKWSRLHCESQFNLFLFLYHNHDRWSLSSIININAMILSRVFQQTIALWEDGHIIYSNRQCFNNQAAYSWPNFHLNLWGGCGSNQSMIKMPPFEEISWRYTDIQNAVIHKAVLLQRTSHTYTQRTTREPLAFLSMLCFTLPLRAVMSTSISKVDLTLGRRSKTHK